jgi:hypothetical protein
MSDDPQEAIDRARRHLRNAARESLEASRALVDAALLAGSRFGGEDDIGRGGLAGEVKRALDAWIAALESDKPFRMPEALAEPLRRAVQTEIDRWEKRSIEDESARPVLRAFLGLRELLWELGMRTEPSPAKGPSSADREASGPSDSSRRSKDSRQRVQRFDLED